MKISRVEVLCANRAVYAKVYTDNGLYGIGESGAWGLLAASGEAIKISSITGSICIVSAISVAQP